MNKKHSKILNKNYILLLQGQLVSTIGDSLYSIALAFYVLKLTGSTALVGMIVGMLILSIVTIRNEMKYHVYRLSVFAFIGFVSLGAAVKLTLCMEASPARNFIGGFIAEAVSPRIGIIYSGVSAFMISFVILCKKDIRDFFASA